MAGARRQVQFSQNLASAAIAESISFTEPFKLLSIEFKFSASLTDTITIKKDNAAGANYDATLSTLEYSSDADGYNTYGDNYIFLQGDKLAITSTTATAAIVYGTIIVELI